MIITQPNNKEFKSKIVIADGKDGIHIRHNYSSVMSCKVLNTMPHKGHIDAIQLIPFVDWYALGKLEHIRIKGNEIESTANLQGICAFDGIFSRLTICDNTIKTTSPHRITINGMLDGKIRDNFDESGQPIKATLNPARIAGSANLWVMSFADTYTYEDVEGDEDFINDRRFDEKRKGTLLYDFPLLEFRNKFRAMMRIESLVGVQAQCDYAVKLALELCKTQKEVR